MENFEMGLRKPGKIFVNDKSCVPVIGTKYSAGLDVKANIHKYTGMKSESITLEPGENINVPTGLYFQLPQDTDYHKRLKVGVFCKSGLVVKEGIWVGDVGVTGELYVCVINAGLHALKLTHGQIIAQVVVSNFICHAVNKNDSLISLENEEIEPLAQVLLPVSCDQHLETYECGLLRTSGNYDNLTVFPGVIDSDYTGQILVYCMNENKTPIRVTNGCVIGHMMRFDIINFEHFFEIIMMDENCTHFPEKNKISLEIKRNERGSKGIGSTSKIIAKMNNKPEDCAIYRGSMTFSKLIQLCKFKTHKNSV